MPGKALTIRKLPVFTLACACTEPLLDAALTSINVRAKITRKVIFLSICDTPILIGKLEGAKMLPLFSPDKALWLCSCCRCDARISNDELGEGGLLQPTRAA